MGCTKVSMFFLYASRGTLPAHQPQTLHLCRDTLQRSILPLIANELLDRLQADAGSKAAARISAGGAVSTASPAASPASSARPSSGSLADRSARAGAASDAWQDRMRQRPWPRPAPHTSDSLGSLPKLLSSRSELLLATAAMHEGSVRGRSRTHRGVSAGMRQADEQVKAARCAARAAICPKHQKAAHLSRLVVFNASDQCLTPR